MRISKNDILDAVLYCYMCTDEVISKALASDQLSEEEIRELKNQRFINNECFKALLKRYFKISG